MREDRNWNGAFLVPNYVNLKIVPELVPSGLWGKAPRAFIGKKSWDRVRKYVRERAGNKCEICGSEENLEVHERYMIKGNYLILARLICVCKRCHSLIHPGFTISQSKNREQTFHQIVENMAKINKIKESQMNNIVCYCFTVHAELGHITEMDYSMLAEEPELSKFLPPYKVQQARFSKIPE